MTSSPPFTVGFPRAGDIAYRPTEATCGFACSSLEQERDDSDHSWSFHLRHTGRAIDRVTAVCRWRDALRLVRQPELEAFWWRRRKVC